MHDCCSIQQQVSDYKPNFHCPRRAVTCFCSDGETFFPSQTHRLKPRCAMHLRLQWSGSQESNNLNTRVTSCIKKVSESHPCRFQEDLNQLSRVCSPAALWREKGGWELDVAAAQLSTYIGSIWGQVGEVRDTKNVKTSVMWCKAVFRKKPTKLIGCSMLPFCCLLLSPIPKAEWLHRIC